MRHENGLYYYFTVEPEKDYWSATFPPQSDDASQLKVMKAMAAIRLLVAAVIRDFWVVEHRERVFQEKHEGSTSPHTHRQDDVPRIVYLPRVKYDYAQPPDISTCQRELDSETCGPILLSAILDAAGGLPKVSYC